MWTSSKTASTHHYSKNLLAWQFQLSPNNNKSYEVSCNEWKMIQEFWACFSKLLQFDFRIAWHSDSDQRAAWGIYKALLSSQKTWLFCSRGCKGCHIITSLLLHISHPLESTRHVASLQAWETLFREKGFCCCSTNSLLAQSPVTNHPIPISLSITIYSPIPIRDLTIWLLSIKLYCNTSLTSQRYRQNPRAILETEHTRPAKLLPSPGVVPSARQKAMKGDC